MAHGGESPDFDLPYHILAVLPTDPGAQIDLGLKIISRALNFRKSEILLMQHQAADKDRHIADLEEKLARFTSSAAGTGLGDAVAENMDVENNTSPVLAPEKEVEFKDVHIDDTASKTNVFNPALTVQSPLGPVTEDEIRVSLSQRSPMTTQDLVFVYKARLKSQEARTAFARVVKKISKLQKMNGLNYVILREQQ